MSESIENNELVVFYQNVLQEIKSNQLSAEEGGNLEQLFTDWASELLSEKGDVEDKARVAYDEKFLGTKKQHKINGYFISENNLTLELYITIFKGTTEPIRIGKDEIDTAEKRISNFFRKGIYNEDYLNEIEESSEIFDLALALSKSQELRENLERVNIIILTDGLYPGEIPKDKEISGYPLYYRVVDLDYLNNISEKSHIPIEIDFKQMGLDVPCVMSPNSNEEYQAYLAIIPGTALASIYEKYGSRLLEQNVRSFLQFTGKINKGIRTTIIKEPEMFLAFNNGLAATAEELTLESSNGNNGMYISKILDFQIVNGGQTTASIFHTFKKDKADVSNIFVQAKISVVKDKENFSEIVSRISEYANTQNKVSLSDLSSNRPYHIQLEKISRIMVTPHIQGQPNQTKWFYERARGQYKNARQKEGFTKAKQKAFDLKNPKNQVFKKEDLAKYINAYQEITDGRKLGVGPYVVVRGSQKNYVQFMQYNLVKEPDSIYFEDVVAKMILFRSAEKIYGVKPNSIGDLRYITVPYSISYLGYKTDYKLDLYKIWRNQSVSEKLSNFLYDLMVKVESFIKTNAPGALFGEWAKKEECWNMLKESDLDVDFSVLKSEFADSKTLNQRTKITDEEKLAQQENEELELIKSIPSIIWGKIENWGRESEKLTTQQIDTAYKLKGRIRNNSKISDYERQKGVEIIDVVADFAPEILHEIDNIQEVIKPKENNDFITLELINQIVAWDKKNRALRDFEFKFMFDLSTGKKELTERNKNIVALNLEKVKRRGFAF